MTATARLDHTVINVRMQMDEAEAWFRQLGFCLTERGYHTLGSINHLMMFGTDYLELIGLPEGADGSGRKDILTAPLGINGLVFKTDDVDETFAHLGKIGMAGEPPRSFSRPVELGDRTLDARFRTVNVRADVFPGGRVYFCEHQTPELVWRPEWQTHDNGVAAMPEFVIVSERHAAEARDMAALLDSNVDGDDEYLSVVLDGAVISFLTPAAYAQRYGALASNTAGRGSMFGAMVMRTDDLEGIRRFAGRADAALTASSAEADRFIVRHNRFDCVLEFIA